MSRPATKKPAAKKTARKAAPKKAGVPWPRNKKRTPEAQRYSVTFTWSIEDNAYLAVVNALEGCMTHGRTLVEAAAMAEEAMEAYPGNEEGHPPPDVHADCKTILPRLRRRSERGG